MTRMLVLLSILYALALSHAPPVSAQDVPAPEAAAFDLPAAIAEGPPLAPERAAELAVASAPTLSRASALSRAAEASVSRARAAMLPRLELSASYVHVDGFADGAISTGVDPATLDAARALAAQVTDPAAQTLFLGQISAQSAPGFSIVIPRDRLDFGARLTWPVSDVFFAMLPALDAAEAGTRARRHEVRATEAGVRRSALEAYWTLARARGALAVTREAERQAQAASEDVEAAVRAGYLTATDRLAAQARVLEVGQAMATAEAGVEIANAALRMLTGEAGEGVYGVALGEGAVPDVDVGSALGARPELAALREALAAQRAAAQVEESRGYPHLALFGGANVANPNRYQIPPQQVFTPSWELGAMLTWSPNDTLVAVHRGEELGAERAALEAQLAQLERGVTLEVQQARARVRAAQRGVLAANASAEAAEAAYASRLAQLRAGATTTAELFAAEGAVNRARLAVLDAEVQLRVAAVQLRHAGGVL